MGSSNQNPIPYDPEWWNDWRERAKALTPEEIEGMNPAPETSCEPPAEEIRHRRERQAKAKDIATLIKEHADEFREVILEVIAAPIGELIAELSKG